MRKIYFVTTNTRKFEESAHILKDFEVERLEPDFPEIQGEPYVVVRHKAKVAADYFQKPIIVDDTSLIFEAFKTLPGVYINDFMQNLGYDKLGRLLDSFENKKAYALALISYCKPNSEPEVFEGKINGRIVEPRGTVTFGWDPIFEPEGYTRTFAEMGIIEKSKISHRKIALDKLKTYLNDM